MMLKRTREGADLEDIHTMANCLILLSSSRAAAASAAAAAATGEYGRVFECKTCNRQFPSFQALGGHRASHKKPKVVEDPEASPPKPKAHECAICGLEFPIGQALGGHMRRHRSVTDQKRRYPLTSLSLSPPPTTEVFVKKADSSRRVLCLDLNLTPSENKFLFGNVAPAVDCFF